MRLSFFIVFTLLCRIVLGQCGFSGSIPIPDATVTQYFVNVSGALYNDMSTSSQGVCRVNLQFKHPHIGDLEVRLKSPGGQVVRLIGAVGNSANTSGSMWNIHFVPQSMPAAPDIGIFPQWSNGSNWIANNSYNGTYYPMAGNQLEQFNFGPVNGLWTFEFTDGTSLDVGQLTSFSIEFCQPQGISCTPSIKDAGVFSIKDITACQGSPSLKPNLTIQYNNGGNNGTFTFKFLVSRSDDKIIAVLDSLDFRSFPPGTYQACGFVVNISDVSRLPSTDSTELMTDWRNRYYNGFPKFPGDISLECVMVRIKPVSPPQVKTLFICKNGPIYFEGDTITTPGNYSYTFKNRFGCDSVIIYSVLPIQFNNTLSVSNPLSCSRDTVILKVQGQSPPQSNYTWFNDLGVIKQGVDLDSIPVTSPGEYFVAIEKSGCRDTFSTVVPVDITLPEVSIQPLHLDCDMPTGVINTTVNPGNVIYQWSGPGGFSSQNPDPTVNFPGVYEVEVTKTDGCRVARKIKVTGDFAIPDFKFNATIKNCSSDTTQVIINTSADIRSYVWTLPDGNQQFGPSIMTNQNGKVYLTITSTNGCTKTDSLNITFKAQNPEISVSDAVINCSQPAINLPASTQQNNFSIVWTGPGGFSSNLLNPLVDTGGLYTAVATGPNNCTTRVSIIITEDFKKPALSITPAQFKCKTDSLRINTVTNPAQVAFSWQGPKQFTSFQSDPYVRETGWYYVTVTAANGCTRMDSVFVGKSTSNPDVTVDDGQLTCLIDSAQLIVNPIYPVNPNYIWTGPNNFSSGLKSPWVKVPGKYWVKVVSKSTGCFTNKSVIITDYTMPPEVRLYQDSINCVTDQATLRFNIDTSFVAFYWITPPGDTIFQQNKITTDLIDTFDLIIRNNYGCVLDTFAVVTPSLEKPVITLPSFVLNCSKKTIQLSATFSKMIQSYQWTFPDGSIRTTKNPSTGIPGDYSLKVIANNGCTDSVTFQVVADTASPIIQIFDVSLSCKQATDTLAFSSSIPGGSYLWQGPGQFISTNANPVITEGGIYSLTVTAPNGCKGDDSTMVIMTDTLPGLNLKDDTLTCMKQSIILKPVTDALSPAFIWTDPAGNSIVADSLFATLPGTYVLQLTDQFQCVVRDTLTLAIDTLKPVTNISSEYFINCKNDSLEIKGSKYVDLYTYEWYLNQNLISADTSIKLIQSGDYSVILKGKNGCILRRDFKVVTDIVKPNLTVIGGELNCEHTKIQLIASSTTPGVQLSWQADSLITGSTLTVDRPGWFTAIAKGANGCVSDTLIRVDSNFVLPDIVTEDGSLSCDSSNYLLHATTQSKGSSFGWFGPNNFFSDQPSVIVNDTGYYYLFLKGANGCLSIDTVYVDDDPPYPDIALVSDSITCYSPSVPIYLNSPDFIESQNWTGPGGFTSGEQVPLAVLPGTYHVVATNEYGCPSMDSIFIPADTLRPDVEIIAADSIFCNHREIILEGKTDGGQPVSFEWSTLNGQLKGDKNQMNILIRDTGTYTLTIVNLRNGCSQSKDTLLEEVLNPIDSLILQVKPASCEGVNDGEIVIEGAIGAQGGLQYSIWDDYYGKYNYYNKLSPGDYYIQVKDTFGCIFGDSVHLGLMEPIDLNLGPDTTIRLGQTIPIEAVMTLDSSLIASISWQAAPSDCNGCLSFFDRPENSTIYSLKVKSVNGCTAEDSKLVIVESNDLIFVPNVFSPNGDGKNDFLDISVSPAVETIEQIIIADRWGNIVFSRENMPPGDESANWDGRFSGTPVNPGVFVYLIKYRLMTGEQLLVKGSVTVVR